MALRQPLRQWAIPGTRALSPSNWPLSAVTPPGTTGGLVVDKQPPPPWVTCNRSAAVVPLLPQQDADELPFVVEPLTPVSQACDTGGGGCKRGDGGAPARSKGDSWPTLTDDFAHGQRQSAATTETWWGGCWGQSSGRSGRNDDSGGSLTGGNGEGVGGARHPTRLIWADDRPGDSLDWEDLEGDDANNGEGDEALDRDTDIVGIRDGDGPPAASMTTDAAGRLLPADGVPVARPPLPQKVEGTAVMEKEVALVAPALALKQTRAASPVADGGAATATAATIVTTRGTSVDEREITDVAAAAAVAAATGLAAAALRQRRRLRWPADGPSQSGAGARGGGVTRETAAIPSDRQRRAPPPAWEHSRIRAPLSTPTHGSVSSPPPTPTVTPAAVEAICALAGALHSSTWVRASPGWRASIAVTVTALLFPAATVQGSTTAAPAAVAATTAVTNTATAAGGGTITPVLPPSLSVLSSAVLTPFLHRTATAHGFPLVEVWLPVLVANDGRVGGGGFRRPLAAAVAATKGIPTSTTTGNEGDSSTTTKTSTGASPNDWHPVPPPISSPRRCSHLRLGWTTLAPNISPADATVLLRYASRSARVTFRPASGLPGRVYVTRRPEVVGQEGLTDHRVFRRASAAKAVGLGAAFAVPLLVRGGGRDEEQVGAVLLFSRVGESPGGATAVAAAVDEVRGWARLLSTVTG